VEQPAARANDRRTADPTSLRGKLLWQTVVKVHPRRCSAGGLGALGQDGKLRRQSAVAGPVASAAASRPTAALVRRLFGAIPEGASPAGGNYRRRCLGARRGGGLHPGWAPHPLLPLPHMFFIYL